MKIMIAGPPTAGKSTLGRKLAQKHGCRLRSTDELIGMDWSDVSLEVSKWMDEPGDWVIEGVAVPRAIRKWIDTRHMRPKVDAVVWLPTPRLSLSPGQISMAKGCQKVYDEIRPHISALLRAPGSL